MAGKYGFYGSSEKNNFSDICGKLQLSDFSGKLQHISGGLAENKFFDFGRKYGFYGSNEKILFPLLAGNCNYPILAENCSYPVKIII